MLDQILLPHPVVVSPPRPPGAVFFALFPDKRAVASASQVASQLRDEHDLKGKPLDADRFHVTLQCIGAHPDLPSSVVDAACEAAATIVVRPFEVTFDRAGSFSGGQPPLVLRGGDGLAPLIKFQNILAIALLKAAPVGTGLRRLLSASFNPHMTLLYDRRSMPEQRVKTIRWTVREFVLVHSLYGRHKHVLLCRWPLRG